RAPRAVALRPPDPIGIVPRRAPPRGGGMRQRHKGGRVMGTNRKESGEEQQAPPRPSIALPAETLRSPASTATGAEGPPRGEAGISMFWRVFGGTLLSIAALVCMTVYQQFSSSLSDLRAAVNHVNELQADVLKKDELNTRTNAIWATLKNLDNDV